MYCKFMRVAIYNNGNQASVECRPFARISTASDSFELKLMIKYMETAYLNATEDPTNCRRNESPFFSIAFIFKSTPDRSGHADQQKTAGLVTLRRAAEAVRKQKSKINCSMEVTYKKN